MHPDVPTAPAEAEAVDPAQGPPIDRATARGVRRRGLTRRAIGRRGHLWPLAVVSATVLLVWALPALPDFADIRLSNPGDSESFAYYLSWNAHALLTFQDPFFAPQLYSPQGLDLGNAISLPAVSLLVAPVAILFGGTAAYNAAFLLAILFGSAAIYLLARELFGSIVGALLAAELMVVSPYFVGHSLGHLNLLWIFGLPFIAYLVVRHVKGRLRTRFLVLWVAVTVAFTAGASTELLVTESLFGLLALVIVLVVARRRLRRRALRSLPGLLGGAVLGVILALPVIIAAIRSGIPAEVQNPASAYPTDVTNILAPSALIRFGESSFAPLWALWRGNVAENTAFIPVTLLALLAILAFRARGRMPAALAIFAGLAMLASFGPNLTIAGVPTVYLPWRLAVEIPGIDHALPVRFSAFVFMAVLLLFAWAWAKGILRRWMLGVLAAASMVLLIPSFVAVVYPVDASDPPFVTSGDIRETIEPGENVLVLPAGQWGPGMRWQDKLDFSFDLPTGNGGGARLPLALEDPVGRALYTLDLGFDYSDSLARYLDEYKVDLIIVDDRASEWTRIVESALDEAPVEDGGVSIFTTDD